MDTIPASVILVIFLVGAGFGTYLYLMIFYPEWVGITGKSAKKTLSEHQEGSKAEDEGLFQEPPKK